MKFGSDIQVPLRMNCKNFGDPLTFHPAPSSGQHVSVSNTLVYDQIPAELQTLPSASAGLSDIVIVSFVIGWLSSGTDAEWLI